MDEPVCILILLVDDSAIIREGLVALLSRQTDLVVIAEAVNGQEALEAYTLHQPDVVLMDVSMPVMDGIAATVALQKRDPSARVILFSSNEEAEALGRQAGARAFLLKTVPRQELFDTLRAVYQADRSRLSR